MTIKIGVPCILVFDSSLVVELQFFARFYVSESDHEDEVSKSLLGQFDRRAILVMVEEGGEVAKFSPSFTIIEAVEVNNFLESVNRHVFNLMVPVGVPGENFCRWDHQIVYALSMVELTQSKSMYAFQLSQINQFLGTVRSSTCCDGSFSANQITILDAVLGKNSSPFPFGHP